MANPYFSLWDDDPEEAIKARFRSRLPFMGVSSLGGTAPIAPSEYTTEWYRPGSEKFKREAEAAAVREDPSGIAVLPSPLDSDYTRLIREVMKGEPSVIEPSMPMMREDVSPYIDADRMLGPVSYPTDGVEPEPAMDLSMRGLTEAHLTSPSEYLGSIEGERGTTIGGLPSGPGIGGGTMVDPTWASTGALGPPEHTIDPITGATVMALGTPAGLLTAGTGALLGAGLGAAARAMAMGRRYAGSYLPSVTAREYAAARAATESANRLAGTAKQIGSGGAITSLGAGHYAFPVAPYGAGWKGRLAEAVSKGVNVMSSKGLLNTITDDDKLAIMGKVAQAIHGSNTAATRGRVLATLKSELPDHDLSTAKNVSNYMTNMLKGPALGQPPHIYSRNIPGPHGTTIASNVDAALRNAMNDFAVSKHGTATVAALKGAGIGGAVGGIAGLAKGVVDDFSDWQTNPGRYAELTSVRGTGPVGSSIGQYGVDDQGVMVPTMTSALQQSINVGASDPNAPAGQVDIDASPTGWAPGQALVDRFGNPVTLSNDPQSVAAANYRSFLADKDINVANTIAAALARADEAIAGMGLTGAAAEKASALVSAELGYLSADQIQGLATQQAEQVAAEQAAAQAFAAEQAAAAAQAVDDFSDYPSQGDYYGPDGEIVSAEEDWGAVSNEAIANMMADIAEANAEAAAVSAVNQDIMAALDDMRGGYGGWSGGDDAGMGDYGGSDTGGGGGGGYGI